MSLEFFGHTHASFLTKFLLTCYNRILVKHFLPASVKVVMARDRGSRLYFKVSFKRGGSKKFLSEQGVLANTIVLVDKRPRLHFRSAFGRLARANEEEKNAG